MGRISRVFVVVLLGFVAIFTISTLTSCEGQKIKIKNKQAQSPKEEARYHFDQGTAARESGQIDTAIYHYLRAITLDPEMAEAYYYLALIFYGQKNYRESSEYLKRYLQLRPKDANGYFRLAQAYRYLHEFTQAEKAYLKAIDLNPDMQKAYYYLAHLYEEMGDQEQAKTYYTMWLEMGPPESLAEPIRRRFGINKTTVKRKSTLSKKKETKVSISKVKVEKKKENLPTPLSKEKPKKIDQQKIKKKSSSFEEAKRLFKEKKLEEALLSINTYLKHHPKDIDAHLLKARIYMGDMKLDEAREETKRVLSMDKNNAEAYLILGNTFYFEELPNAAKKAYLKAIELDPKLPETYYYLGVLYKEYFKKEEKKTKMYFNKYLEIGKDPLKRKRIKMWLKD